MRTLDNIYASGIIFTTLFNNKATREDLETQYNPKIALGRLGDAIDVAKVVVFLFSEASGYVSSTVSQT